MLKTTLFRELDRLNPHSGPVSREPRDEIGGRGKAAAPGLRAKGLVLAAGRPQVGRRAVRRRVRQWLRKARERYSFELDVPEVVVTIWF